MRTLLQISPKWQEDHGDGHYARFKCLSCHKQFTLNIEDPWEYCPKCGNKGGTTYKEIERKKYYDNAGVHVYDSKLGKWVHLKAPVFQIVIEFCTDWDGYGAWEPYQYSERGIYGRHDDIKRYIQSKNKKDRFRLIPSKMLPLP